ncbi:hypothetical protein [Niveibacterium sp. SC-1]|uniref:hypothetical protein n=1 Tax=Niveibacterium sp. SC-1 TaxID=3135646 RepID=UPI00311D8758
MTDPVESEPMDISQIRRARLKQLIDDQFGGVVLRFAEAMDMKPPQVHRWLTQAKSGQNIREDSARNIETRCGLTRGWMDLPEGGAYQLTTAAQSPLSAGEAVAQYRTTAKTVNFDAATRVLREVCDALGVSFDDIVEHHYGALHPAEAPTTLPTKRRPEASAQKKKPA